MKHIKDSLLNETVKETLERIGMVNEMAVSLKKYCERVDGLRLQLVENWCLCKYCQLYNETSNNYKHWLAELRSCINNLKLLDIKGSSNKRKTLIRMLIDDYDYNDKNMILRIIVDKFDMENIMDQSQRIEVSKQFVSNVESLIDVISINDMKTNDYLKKTFDF